MKLPEYDEQAAQRESDEMTSLSLSIYWLKAIVEQGARVFDADAQPDAHSNSATFNSRSRMEQQFFLTACEKAQRWIKPMELGTPEAKQFLVLGEAINKVRGEREHDDERYGLGNDFERIGVSEHAKQGSVLKDPERTGKKPNPRQEFRMEKADTTGGAAIVMDMAGTLKDGGRLLLGGKVDVAEVVSAAEILIELLVKEQHAYCKRRFTHGWESDEEASGIVESYHIEPRFRP